VEELWFALLFTEEVEEIDPELLLVLFPLLMSFACPCPWDTVLSSNGEVTFTEFEVFRPEEGVKLGRKELETNDDVD